MKSLTKYPTSQPVNDLRKEMDRIFNDLIPFTWRFEDAESGVGYWNPTTDMFETDNEYLISVDLPGMKKQDVQISYHNNIVTVEGERKREEIIEKKGYLRNERYFGAFKRSFMLPTAIKDDKIKAKFEDGVLRLSVPKAEKSKRKSVTID